LHKDKGLAVSNIEKSGVRIRPQAPDFRPQIEEEEIEKFGVWCPMSDV
jgi:hypothetical protein